MWYPSWWRNVTLVFTIGYIVLMPTLTRAEEPPPITQLPHDIVKLATVWWAVPHAMYQVSQDEGSVMGMTLGTVEGSSLMVESTVTYLTSGYHYTQQTQPTPQRRPTGALLRYSF